MTAYYNEHDPIAAEWLRWLIGQNLIAPGEVDSRSIIEVQPDDLRGFTQCHFFAGIGGWSYAARLAGWPDDRPLWTASCPCQPFSVAGKGAGADDERHLWTDAFRLIRAARPAVCVGEQVAGKAGYGWLDGVRADLAGENYACRYVDIPALAVDAPHIRSRGYWVALADSAGIGCEKGSGPATGREARARARKHNGRPLRAVGKGNLGNAVGARLEGHAGHGDDRPGRQDAARSTAAPDGRNGSAWSDHEWIACHDGKARRTQPGLSMLVDGLPGRVAAWRGFGNAIVPQLAAEVIGALLDTEGRP